MGIIAVIIAGIFLAVMVLAIPARISWMRRRNRLRTRAKRSFDDWYVEFYREEHPDKQLITEIHEVIGNEVGIDPTQIYPTDRFDVELRCPEWWGLRGYELEGLEEWITYLLYKNDKSPPAGFPTARTVGELVRELESVLLDKDKP